MTPRSILSTSIPVTIALLCLAGCEDACHDGDPSTCCCRDRWGTCRDPSNGDLPDENVTCSESSSSSQSGSSGSSKGATTTQVPPPPQLPAPYAPSGFGSADGWDWTVKVGLDYPLKLCCAPSGEDLRLVGNCQEVHWTDVKVHTAPRQVLSCQTTKDGWIPSPIGSIGTTAY